MSWHPDILMKYVGVEIAIVILLLLIFRKKIIKVIGGIKWQR